MSAPSLLSDVYSVPDPAFTTAYSRLRHHPAALRPDPGTASRPSASGDGPDSIDRLALSLADLCRSAVDPLAIVAGLEAEGYNDRTAAEQFGLPDLFALAEELHRRVPRELHPPRVCATAPTARGTIRAILHGLLFAAPSLCVMAFLINGLSGMARDALAVVQVLAWGYGQGVAHLAYGRLGSADRRGAARILRTGTLSALLASASLFGFMHFMLGTALTALLPATTGLWICLTATPALVLGAEYAMAVTLVPAALTAIAAGLGAPSFVALAGAQLSALTAVLFMLALTRHWKGARPRLTWRELRESLPHVFFGLGIGTLITVVLAGPAVAGEGLVALHAAIVLTLGMGAAEWHARWHHRQIGVLLTTVADPARFSRPAMLLMLRALLRQAATTAALAGLSYCVLDRHKGDAVGLYCFAVALAPGLLAGLFVRAAEARAVLWPTAIALAATFAALPSRDTAILAALALEASVLFASRAVSITTRPWVHL